MSEATLELREELAPAQDSAAGFFIPRTRQFAVIASIWPLGWQREEQHYQPGQDEQGRQVEIPHTQYVIPPSADSMTDALSNVRLLRVYDTYMRREIPETKKPERLPLPARVAAEGLVQTWTGIQGGARTRQAPGVMVLVGKEPTQQELQRLMTMQSGYLQRVCIQAQEAYLAGEIGKIGDMERMAARWLNQASNYNWVPMDTFNSTKKCISCGASIPYDAVVCKVACGDLIQKARDGYWTLQELKEMDPFLYDRVRLIEQRAADRERKAAERAAGGKE